MKTSISITLVLLAFGLAFNSCTKYGPPSQEGTLDLRIDATFNDEAFAAGNAYLNEDGYNVRVDFFKFYLSNLLALKADGTFEPLLDIDLIDLEDGLVNIPIKLPAGDYTGIQFGIGVPEEWNKDQDPTQYPNDHPLSVNGSDGMFWTWNTGYIFLKIEGKADLQGGDNIISPFAFHCGEDVLYRTHVADQLPFKITGGKTETINIHFDMEKFFHGENDQIDIAVDNLTHTGGNIALAERFTDLFNEAISVE